MNHLRPPKAVIFDLGKVLLDFDYGLAARNIAARSNHPPQSIRELLDHAPLLFEFERGRLTVEQFFAEVCRITAFRGDLTEFSRFFSDIFTPIEPMIQLHAGLCRRGIPTYIFSNTNLLAVTHIRGTYPFFRHFDGYVLSYEHGAMKPEAPLYESVERLSGYRSGDLLYLDDRPENIAAGAARGWQVILQESPAKTLPLFQQRGLAD